MPKQSQAATEAVPAVSPEASQEPAKTVEFAEPVSAKDLTAEVSTEAPKGWKEPVISDAQMDELRRLASHDNTKFDFMKKVQDARAAQAQAPAAPPPIADRVREQTAAEMAAGAHMNKHYAELHARHRPPAPEPDKSQAVFRPADYVPDQKKGQGYVQGRNL